MISYFSGRVSPADIENRMEQVIPPAVKYASLPISVAIVSYNSRELLRACLISVEAEQCGEVIVVDNASFDGSEEMVRQDFPWVQVTRRNENEGYGAAANVAIASCSSEYVLLLNSDTLLQPGTLQALSDYLCQHPQAAVVGPSLVNPDGTRQASCFHFPTPMQTLLRETSLSQIRADGLSGGSPRFAGIVPWVLGAALAIRRSAFEAAGGFDRSFFMYFEEVDLCYRLNQSGWQAHFTPAATVIHIGGASTKRHRTAMAMELYKSLCHFYEQHYSGMQKFQLRLVLTYLMLRNVVKSTLWVACGTYSRKVQDSADDLLVWRSVLSNVWSPNGWLRH